MREKSHICGNKINIIISVLTVDTILLCSASALPFSETMRPRITSGNCSISVEKLLVSAVRTHMALF